ncbi:MAG: hypothetical protein EHM62_02860, partial [Methylococcus sp.]
MVPLPLQRLSGSRAVRAVLAVLLLAVIGARLDGPALLAVFQRFDGRFAVAMLAVCGLLLGAFAWRWALIGSALGIRAGYVDYLRGLWLSQAVGEMGPALLAGEWARFHALKRQATQSSLLASQIIDRASGQIALVLLVVFLLPVYGPLISTLIGSSLRASILAFVLLLAALLIGLIWLVRLMPGLREQAQLSRIILNPLRCPAHYGVSCLIQGLLVLNWVLAAGGFGLIESSATVALLAPLLLLGVGSLPGLISDWGKREAAAVLILAPAGL